VKLTNMYYTMFNRAYKYCLMPNQLQEELLQKHFGHCRFVYNHFLQVKIDHYKKTKKTIRWQDLATQLPKLKETNEWLSEIGSQSLQQSILNLDRAYTSFFRSGTGFPKFKSKKYARKSFIIPNTNGNIKLNYNAKRLVIPKFRKGIKCIFDRPTEGTLKQAIVSQDRDGKYYVSILVEVNKELPTKPEPKRNKAIGMDFGVRTFITLNDGTKIENPKVLKQSSDKLAKHQQDLETLTNGSTTHISKQEQITKLHSKIARQRKDFLDKLSHKLTHDNQVNTICIEDLSIKNMQADNYKATNNIIADLSWNEFVNMLQYKSDWYGKNFRKIGRFDPSSKMCSQCGHVNHNLKRDDYEWTCPDCNTHHDRDVNAANNILDFSFPKTEFNKGRNYPIEALMLEQRGNPLALAGG
jgi:putative transposase